MVSRHLKEPDLPAEKQASLPMQASHDNVNFDAASRAYFLLFLLF
jgi:hypothetical protein